MSTLKQQKLAKEIVNNVQSKKVRPASELLENVGYSTSVARAKSGEMISRKGVQEELEKLGFSEENAKEVVGTILLDESVEEKDRLKAVEMIFKCFGSFAPEKRLNVNVEVLPSPKVKDLAKKLNYGGNHSN